jgi:LPXTG-motif cell wall-anchored protein
VSTKDESAAVSTDANQATDQTATASAGTDQKAASDSAQLPETASPLPLLGLLGFASTGLGLLMRRK